MSVAAMCAGDVVFPEERFTNPHRHRFLYYVEMSQARNQGSSIEVVHMLLEHSNADHVPVHSKPLFHGDFGMGLGTGSRSHCSTPDMCANTSNITAKSFLSIPIARAAVRNSLLTAVVGNGTLSCRPISSASSMSFCIMFTSNH